MAALVADWENETLGGHRTELFPCNTAASRARRAESLLCAFVDCSPSESSIYEGNIDMTLTIRKDRVNPTHRSSGCKNPPKKITQTIHNHAAILGRY